MLTIPKSPIAASIFSGLAGIASIYAGPKGFMLELAGEKEIARVTADENGNYRVAQPPGDYVLKVQERTRTHLRCKPQQFTIVSNQTVLVDIAIIAEDQSNCLTLNRTEGSE